MKTKIITLIVTFIFLILPYNSLANSFNIKNIIWENDYSIKFDEVKNAHSYKYNFSVNNNNIPTTLFTINKFERKNGTICFFPGEALEHFKNNTPSVYRVWIIALDENNNELTNLTQSIGGKIIMFSKLPPPQNVRFYNGMGEWKNVSNSNIYKINLYEVDKSTPLFQFSTKTNTFDFSEYLELDKKYYFEVQATNKESIYKDSDIVKSNPFTLSLYNIFTNSTNGTIKTYYDGNDIYQAEVGQELKVVITPAEGYLTDTVTICNNIDTSVNIELTEENTFIMPNHDILITATFLKKAEMPSITFEATGYDCGILKNPLGAKINYSIDNKETWISTSENSIYLENVSPKNNIIAYTPKDNIISFIDSDLKKLNIKRASTPENIVAVSPTSSQNNDGKIVGTTASMQYKLNSSSSWIDCLNSNAISHLIPGTYEVREKPLDSTLASESVLLKLEKYEIQEDDDKPIKKFEILVIQSEGGKIEPDTKNIREGKSCEFTITPNEGYKIKNIFIDELDYGILSSYTFNNVRSHHTIVATFEPIVCSLPTEELKESHSSDFSSNNTSWENPFEDVSENAWYYNSIKFSNQNNLLSGITNNKFGPKAPMTRGMLAYVLYNHSQDDFNSSSSIIFSDVKESSYYYKAIAWMYENNIASGMGKNIFKPNEPITREQLVTTLYNYSIYLGRDSKSVTVDFSSFEDSEEIHSWAKVPLCWALNNNLIGGRTKTTLAPREATTRAEFATILMRFLESKTN